jgi:hypothetical protein
MKAQEGSRSGHHRHLEFILDTLHGHQRERRHSVGVDMQLGLAGTMTYMPWLRDGNQNMLKAW